MEDGREEKRKKKGMKERERTKGGKKEDWKQLMLFIFEDTSDLSLR